MITRHFWRELGIMYFAARCDTGQAFEFIAPTPEFTMDTPTVPIVASGKFRGDNPLRGPIEWPALPTKTEGGIAFPGKHRLTALEDGSVYACVCALPAGLTEVTSDMYKLDHRHLIEGSQLEFKKADGYLAVVVMSGRVTDGETIYTAGQRAIIYGESLTVYAEQASHVVGYRSTAAT